MHRFAWCAAIAFTVACEKPPAAPPPAPEVYVAPVVQRDVPVYIDVVGQTEGFQDIDIRARVEGFLNTVNFQEGAFVKKNALLYQIDPEPLRAALAGTKADLATANARLEKTANDIARYTPLVAKQAVSRQELDNATSANLAARSQVDAAKAAVDKAKLDLGYTTVRSPIDGLVGATKAKPGTLVGHGEATLLTTVSRIDPIIFRVGISEAEYLRLARRYPNRLRNTPQEGNIELTLADGTVHPYMGRVGVVERAVNPETGTLGLQLYFPNPKFILRPGQYGHARAVLETKKNALLIPQRAVQEMQNLYSVAVVGPDNKISFRNVTVGQRVDPGLWVIERGLGPGDRVVAEGLQKVRDGLMVQAKPMPAPGAQTPVATSGEK